MKTCKKVYLISVIFIISCAPSKKNNSNDAQDQNNSVIVCSTLNKNDCKKEKDHCEWVAPKGVPLCQNKLVARNNTGGVPYIPPSGTPTAPPLPTEPSVKKTWLEKEKEKNVIPATNIVTPILKNKPSTEQGNIANEALTQLKKMKAEDLSFMKNIIKDIEDIMLMKQEDILAKKAEIIETYKKDSKVVTFSKTNSNLIGDKITKICNDYVITKNNIDTVKSTLTSILDGIKIDGIKK